MPTCWSLFIDESGKFEGGDPSVVAGILVVGRADAYACGRLRAVLTDICGPGPWPPHASHRNIPASRVLYAARTHTRDMPPGRYAAQLEPAIRELTATLERSTMRARLEAIRGGEFPTRNDCEAADAILHRELAYRTVRAVAEHQDTDMGRLVQLVCSRSGGMVVAALADDGPPGPAPAPLQVREDAYVRALSVVIERVSRLAGAHDAECFPLTRHVEAGGLGKEVDMQGFLLRPLLEQAAAVTRSPVRLRAGGGRQRYRDHADQGDPLHPLHVLADWLANKLRAAAGWYGGRYPALEATLAKDLLLGRALMRRDPSRAPALGALPTFAVAGGPEDSVRTALSGGTPRHAAPGGPAWGWDQAREWSDTAGRWP
ncbi:MAG: hypothetical protein V4850_17710 [Myxococcota bacterium]